jgi:predicted DNA binding protein
MTRGNMGVTATLELPLDACPLGTALREVPGVHVRMERTVPTGDGFLPYFWTDASTVRDLTDRIETIPAVRRCSVVDVAGDEALVRVEWVEREAEFLDLVEDSGGTVLQAAGTSSGWSVRVRFEDHADLGRCYRECMRKDVQVTVVSIRGPTSAAETGPGVDMTGPQRRALLEAFEHGYFDVPRRANLEDLARELDVSDTAVSQRLRRGTRRLIESTLRGPDDDHESELD